MHLWPMMFFANGGSEDMTHASSPISSRQMGDALPDWLRGHLAALTDQFGGEVYLAGGILRDLLMGTRPADIDITVDTGARQWAHALAARTGGALVPLGRDEDAARVVWRGATVDFSSFRLGARTIGEELTKRDLTINAMAVRLDPLLRCANGAESALIIDPTGGLDDLRDGLIRMTSPASFIEDPLRLLRVFRFAASLGFVIDPATLDEVQRHKAAIMTVAPERIAHELDLIMASTRAHAMVTIMASVGLLWEIIPELTAGEGMAQPKSHHLDVLGHSLETLRQMEQVMADPAAYFPDTHRQMSAYLAQGRHRLQLKWAALLHDLGKPATFAVKEEKGGRITFYNHDRAGAELFRVFSGRFRWSNDDRAHVAGLIANHMRPFHLANVARAGNLTLRASIRMVKKAEETLPGLFLLSMADALAGQGEERIVGMERELAVLFARLEQVRQERIEPIRTAPPLLTGRDLIEVLHLEPGPLFKEILATVEEAQMEGVVSDFSGALRLAVAHVQGKVASTKKDEE